MSKASSARFCEEPKPSCNHGLNLLLEVHPNEMREWQANGSIAELFKLMHADEYEGTIVCRSDFGKVMAFSPASLPLDVVSK